MPKVLCTALSTETGPHFRILQEAGFDVQVVPRELNLWEPENLIEALRDVEAVVAGSEPYPRRVIEALPKLRVIARSGVGYDAIDLAACDERDIPVCTTPGVNHHSVAEHAIALMMAIARGFPDQDRRVRTNQWKRVARPRMMGRTMGLIGLGRIGQAVATRAVGLGMKVVAYDPFPNYEFAREWNIEFLDLEALYGRADVISLHLPMSAENVHLINKRTISKLKRGTLLINTARGSLVNEQDLYEALRLGHLGGAGLDVFEVEPLPLSSPLLTLDNVLLSGHIAGLDEESAYDTAKMFAEIIVGLQHGRWPEGCVQNLKQRRDWKW